jgi:hypothetical protein
MPDGDAADDVGTESVSPATRLHRGHVFEPYHEQRLLGGGEPDVEVDGAGRRWFGDDTAGAAAVRACDDADAVTGVHGHPLNHPSLRTELRHVDIAPVAPGHVRSLAVQGRSMGLPSPTTRKTAIAIARGLPAAHISRSGRRYSRLIWIALVELLECAVQNG